MIPDQFIEIGHQMPQPRPAEMPRISPVLEIAFPTPTVLSRVVWPERNGYVLQDEELEAPKVADNEVEERAAPRPEIGFDV